MLPRAVSLGNGGSITLGFAKGVLVDGPGPDLFIFEIGPSVEALLVDVSADGKTWIAVGEARGGACAIDIGPHVSPSDVFRFVRLRDVPHQGAESDAWPGADIDAIGVRAAPQRVALPNEVLFEFDSDALASGASGALDRVVAAIKARPRARVTVEGHTDDVGNAEYNQKLSERRAEAVAAYLAQKGVERGRVTARGLGARRPAAPNDSDENRGKNRRVEIVIEEP
jgi:outer membrane protein OmpA-like peptidoglycan-associated protein